MKEKEKNNVYKAARESMVARQLAYRDITDERVLDAFRKVPRHLFVPDSSKSSAYGDFPLPIGEGQTISQPYIVALMTQLLNVSDTSKVLEIGTGSGYQAAILAELAKEVYTIEYLPSLAKGAERILDSLGYDNVHVRAGDGFLGWPENAPFDGIIITCAPEKLPEPLTEQLAIGGRIVVPVGSQYQAQTLSVYTKTDTGLVANYEGGCFFVPMRGMIEAE
ncbi:protein-L-isoaspartate(D-aspartate) O-methyltransferase [candidate division WOR-3 bacterium]|uniref:Protein-L-isoaspartate O-methyltransferase n=1 Tax=candidate division WOR-3 bacterium TaxID=2052148 RepID=A0A9D5QDT9_UNCW3|nr:protein-L-isoaspartate(D-aspartate) O-methyltransferase [candidate division WOR-3 bacterium]MBD3365396.1 protein-L-isoaspartate(D-aspartate) O-methyltransferase [candidate division WOR-3 bacterium]